MDSLSSKLHSLKTNKFLQGSFILFGASMLVNIGNYFFQVILGRFLGPSNYGEFVALTSLTYFAAIPAIAIQTFVAKSSADLDSEGNPKKIKFLILNLLKSILFILSFVSLIVLFSLTNIKLFLNVNETSPFLILLVYMVLTLINPLFTGTLLGTKKFGKLAVITLSEIFIKLGVGIMLTKAGMGTDGALFALTLSALCGTVLGLFFIRKILFVSEQKSERKFNWKEFFGVILPTISINLLFINDLILAKHFLSSTDAGIYSSISVLGRVLFFLSVTIGNVLIPLIVEMKSKNQNYRRAFLMVLLTIVSIESTVLLIYSIFPGFVISIFYGDSFRESTQYLPLFAVAIFMLSIANLFHNFLVSTNKKIHTIFGLVATFAQIILIYKFHSSISEIIMVQIFVIGIFCIAVILYWLKSLR